MLGWRRGRRGGLRGRRWLVRESVGVPFRLCISVSRHSDGNTRSRDIGLGSSNYGAGGVRHCPTVSSPRGSGIPILDRSIIG